MTLRRKFILVFVVFSVVLTAAGGWLAWRTAGDALEAELDEKLVWVAGAAAEVGFEGELALDLRPGDEGQDTWNFYRNRLVRLQRYVDEAYIFQRGGALLLSTRPATELPIGTQLRWLEAYPQELATAWEQGESVTPVFQGDDGRYYKYGFKQLDQSDAMLAVLMRADYLEPLGQLRRTMILGSLGAALLAALLAGLLATNVVRPLEGLSRMALRIQRGRLDRKVDVEREDEVGRLSRAMERMRVGILQRDEQLRLMLAQVAHEIRNPLGGLELFASAAAATDDAEERRELLARIRSEVEDLNAIIDEFLTFARPIQPEIRLHDIRDPVREAAQFLEMELEERGGRLQVDLPDTALMGRADPDHVKRVVLNLLQNAAHAGTEVCLRAEWRNGEVVVTVSDNGPGIPRELRDRIFEPFVTDKEKGAGLGLAIVRRVLETNGARVELADPGPGAPVEVADTGSPHPSPGDSGGMEESRGGAGSERPDPSGDVGAVAVHPGAGPAESAGSGAEFRVYFPGSDDLPTARREDAR